MNRLICGSKSVLRGYGFNRAIGYGVLTRMWGVIAGPVTILLIATRFSKTEQGYYYTFSSLLALQVFFELGLLTVLAQFAAHEFAFLTWGKDGEINGDSSHRDRFVDLLCKGFKWFAVSALFMMLLLIPAGLIFFTYSFEFVDFSWKIPWVLAVIGLGCNLLLIPFYAVITGSGDVASINRREMFGGMLGAIIGWIVMAFGGGLYAIPAITAGSALTGAFYLLGSKSKLLKIAFSSAIKHQSNSSDTISWMDEIWPMQWKIALSWLSGYFIFQLFTPVLFKYYGPVIAGQMGMTLSAVNAVQGVALMWLNTRSPEFGKLIAHKNWKSIDKLFHQIMRQSIMVCLMLSVGTVTIIAFLQSYTAIGSRFLPVSHVIIFLIAVCSNLFVNGWAIYMRAFKKEPLLLLSLVSGVLIGLSTYFFGVKYAAIGMVLGYCLISVFFVMPATFILFVGFKKKNEYIET